ncbi:MAG: type II toxin-antitoxin system RelE/ParE family toxin, partial [Saprospiraceae bacterium]
PAAKKLKSQLLDQIKRIPDNPYMFRQSIYFNNKEIRDLVYKGCTVVYKIESKRIIVFGFLKYQEFPTDKKKW